MVGALLEGIIVTLTNADETVELFLKQAPERALNPGANVVLASPPWWVPWRLGGDGRFGRSAP
jgi:hypothetical protein